MASDNFMKNLGLSQDQIASSVYFSQMNTLRSDIYSYLPNPGVTGSSNTGNIVIGLENNLKFASKPEPPGILGNILIGNLITEDSGGNTGVWANSDGAIGIVSAELPAGSIAQDGQLIICGSNYISQSQPSAVPYSINLSGFSLIQPGTGSGTAYVYPIYINGLLLYLPLFSAP